MIKIQGIILLSKSLYLSYTSYIKLHDMFIWSLLFHRFWVHDHHCGEHGSRQPCMVLQQSFSTHILYHNQERQFMLIRDVMGFWNLNACHIHPSTKPQFLNQYQTVPLTEDQLFKHISILGTFSLKLPQHANMKGEKNSHDVQPLAQLFLTCGSWLLC